MYDDARAAATSYELQRLAGPLPEVVVAPVADMAASINDGPTEDLDIEDQVYSAERIRSQSAGEPAPDPTVSGDLAGHGLALLEVVEVRGADTLALAESVLTAGHPMPLGQIAGRVNAARPVAEVVAELVSELRVAADRLDKIRDA